ncbi:MULTISPECIES: thioesterase II family protein [Streptomyces]|uniref:thioesterase II family protein n=1 Tax=Streptomyces TaxID=1883 RepID=UPI0005DEC320|nr:MULTISPECIES: thioesterase domain-containing protein [unclassified Streptomyces]MDX3486820.1 thioesterase domain-containing protein [Streptomyces sp. ID05-18]OLO35231.1 thioesterase [Streptomyces sp. MNU77]
MTNFEARKWLFREPSDDAPARLFCFPYSGTGASMYRSWPRRIGPVEVLPVQLAARENRLAEDHPGTYEQLAEDAARGLLPYLDRPAGFFGHCGGALSAFATALELEQVHDRPVEALFLSSQVPAHEKPFGRWLWLPREELDGELDALARRLGGEIEPDFKEMALDLLEEDLATQRRYRLDEPVTLRCTVHGIGWAGDVEIRPDQMHGWDAYGTHRHALLDGDHYTFLDAPQSLQDVIAAALDPHPVVRRSRRTG